MKLRRLLNPLAVLALTSRVWAASAGTNAPPPDVFALKPFEWIAPFPMPRLLPAKFPREAPTAAVEHMTFGDQRLWLVVRPRYDTNTPPGTGRLWIFTPDFNRLEPVKGAITNNVITDLRHQGAHLWLSAIGGVGSIDTQTFVVSGYGQGRGLAATNFAGIDLQDQTVLTLSEPGNLFTLAPDASSFVRVTGAAPVAGQRGADRWEHFAASKQWVCAAAESSVVIRNLQGPQWLPLSGEPDMGSPRLAPARMQCLVGDHDGGFWLGTDAGLHWLDPETGRTESRFAPLSVRVPGGLGITIPAGHKVTPAAYQQARDRVMNGVRDLMRDRARRARAKAEGRTIANWMEPTSRIPGGVTALLRDQTWLWLACSDGAATNRSRVLLYHLPTKRWVGWFPLGLPVRSLAADARYLWLGLEDVTGTGAPTLVALEKMPLISVPQARWVREPITPDELGQRLALLSSKERATYAFFAGDSITVAAQLAPAGVARTDLDAEELFLLAFAHDSLGLNQPDKLDQYVNLLHERFRDSLFTELAAKVRPQAAPPPNTTEAPTPSPQASEDVLARRDLNGDGKLNAVEFRLWRGPDAKLADFDRNGDGALDRAEVEAVPNP